MMKLHLGCGQRYFDGYVNIDYPLTEHSVQQKSVADIQANILELKYPAGTIDEVRLHHVFEHFSRPVACAMLTNWYFWLKPSGKLHIEVPDFDKTAQAALKYFATEKNIGVALRHIFGSQEAHWAVHYDGYGKKLLVNFLKRFGFNVLEVKQHEYKGTFNIEVIAEKNNLKLTADDLKNACIQHLKNYLVDESESEIKMLETWVDIYMKHIRY